MKACKTCRLISDGPACPGCSGTDMTEKFSGQLRVADPERSEIAKKLGVKMPGTYAIKIRER